MGLNSHVCENGHMKITTGERLTIENSSEFLRILRESFDSASEIEVEFEPDVEIDLTGMQILCSSCKSAASNGKIFRFSGTQPKSLTDLIYAAGAERRDICKYNNDSVCIWFGGSR